MPEHIRRMLRRRKYNLTEAYNFCRQHDFKCSVGWLSVNRKIWEYREEEDVAVFEEDDEAYDTDLATRLLIYRGEKIKDFSIKKHFHVDILKRFMKRTPEACALFAKECLVWKGQPIIMQPHQLRMVAGWLGEKPTVYPIGRGGGKDFTLSIFLIWYCTCFPNTRVIVVCPASRQVKTFMNENLSLMVQTSSVLFDSIYRSVEEEFVLTNGSVIFTYGATSFIKGKHNIDFIFANEAGDVPEHVFENVLLPMLGVGIDKIGHFGVIGVPAGQQGFMWKAYQQSSQDVNDEQYEYYQIHLPTSVNDFYSKRQLALNKKLMSHDVYIQEHEAKFLDVENALFSKRLLDKMRRDYDMKFGMVDHKMFWYYLGLDWGRHESYTVPTILSVDRKTRDVRVEWLEGMKYTYAKQIPWVEEADKIYDFKVIMPERMGIGIAPCDLLRASLGSSKVKFFIPSATQWFDAFSAVRDAGENDILTIPAGDLKLSSQLRTLQFTMRGDKLTIRSEYKDDFAQSLAVAFWSIKKKGRAGVAGSY